VGLGAAGYSHGVRKERYMKGTLTKVKGQTKRLVGRATGNRRLAARGRAEAVKGDIRRSATRARKRIDKAVRRAEHRVRSH
jgi:uncharacterized protein YjbJ (UPF0337 family)